MQLTFEFLSHFSGAAAFLLLAVYILLKRSTREIDRTLLLASVLNSIWLATIALQSTVIELSFEIRYILELARQAAWFGLIFALLGLNVLPFKNLRGSQGLALGFILTVLAIMLANMLMLSWSKFSLVSNDTLIVMQVTLSIAGLLLIEQVWRNSSVYGTSSTKYLSIALLTLFSYDFLMYSDALLFQQLSTALWDARGAMNFISAVLIGITILRSSGTAPSMQISRQMVFHTTTLGLAGLYLIILSAGGYYINTVGGSWGDALRVMFISVGCLVLLILLSSPSLRAKMMVFVSKNFFDYQYDYREEWIKSTNTLRRSAEEEASSLPLQTIKVLSALIGSQKGCIWIRNEDDQFEPSDTLDLELSSFGNIDVKADIVSFFQKRHWIINLHEFMVDPTKYGLIELPSSMLEVEEPWLIVPLNVNERLTGLVLLCDPVTPIELNWENYDLLKIVAQQASSYIEQTVSQEKLAESRQFEAVSKTSAFLVHDIKTIIAQLSLLVKNAEKHKHNPAFVDDMIRTTHHTVEKMDHLLQQIRNPQPLDDEENAELNLILLDLYQTFKNNEPVPIVEIPETSIWITAHPEELKMSIGHIIQNAVDATPKTGEISITHKIANDRVYLFIQDTGTGMDESFIKNDLFKPFTSTKGLTGMGIGVYQSREYLRKIGGSIDVTSEIDIGTCFTLTIPIKDIAENNNTLDNLSGT